jgi:hypothetical protein
MEQALTNALGPDGIVQARHALASIVQRLFEEERKLEMTASDPIPGAPEYAETQAQGPGGTSGELAASVSGRRQVVPRAEPVSSPTTPSGLTLAAEQAALRAVTIPPVPPVPPAKPEARPIEGGGKRILLYASGVVALLLSALAGNFAPAVMGKTTPTATPTSYETPIAVFTEVQLGTPAPTPEASVAPSAVASSTVARPFPTATRVVVVNTPPRQTPTPTPIAGSAYITVNARPWVQVFVDGKMVIAETPLRRYKLPAGRHTLRFQNPPMKFQVEKAIDIPVDVERNIFVDVKTGALTIR